MNDRTPEEHASTTDQILDLLLDALIERQKARRGAPAPGTQATGSGWRTPVPQGRPPATEEGVRSERQPVESTEAKPAPIPVPRPEPPATEQRRAALASTGPATSPTRVPPRPTSEREPQPGDEGWEPPARLPSIHMGKMLLRLAILVAVLIALVNIPVNKYGTSLARILPESQALVIRDGLVLKGSGPEIYILEKDRLRWISSMDAFEHLGLTWEDVHVVEDSFLTKFKEGPALHVLLKCGGSDHIYRLENDQKRWIKDIDAFLAEGHVWDDVRFVSCQYLRDLPTGPSIPEDAGPAPEP
ncbi:MAG: hypothetical protein JXA93_18560 [Anaerolineae bacterium]|nr:hypothetical protein [Anaerolineae bacterium]